MNSFLNKCRDLLPTMPASAYFFLLTWFLLAFQISSFYLLADFGSFSTFTDIVFAAVDALLILSPYFLIPRKWRWSVIIPMTVMPVFLYVNLLYVRNVGDVMGFSTMFGFTNATGVVATAAFASVKAIDLCIFIPYLVFIGFFIRLCPKIGRKRYSRRFRLIWVVFVLVAFLFQQLIMQTALWSHADRKMEYSLSSQPEAVNDIFPNYSRKNTMRYYGIPLFMAIETYGMMNPDRELSEGELKDIESYLAAQTPGELIVDSLPDNRGRNLILIIVESLNSQVFTNSVNGNPMAPYLDSLTRMPGVIFAPRIFPQVGTGRSSDGRLLYQTGLLPTLKNPMAMKWPEADYPSLRRAFGGEAYEFDSGSPTQWNKGIVSKSYGYDRIYAGLCDDIKPGESRDSILFAKSLPIIRKMKQPFLASLCTMDMHDPYEDYDGVKTDMQRDNSYSRQEKVYGEKVRQFDRSLRSFIDGLKKAGLYDNSIIMIAGDHDALESALKGSRFNSKYIPLIILNSGVELRTGTPLGQVDVYPTLLDVTGHMDYFWKGFGKSLLRNPAVLHTPADTAMPDRFVYPSREDWRLSEMMISGRYFAPKEKK